MKIYRVLILFLLSVFLFFSCAGGPQRRVVLTGSDGSGADYQNRIYANHTGLALPDGWTSRLAVENQSVLFFFFNPQRTIQGMVEYAVVDSQDITLETITTFYEEKVLTNFISLRSFKTTIDDKPTVIITGQERNGDGGIVLTLIREENQINSIEFVGPLTELYAQMEHLSRIAHSYSFIEEKLNARLPARGIRFNNFGSGWNWYEDVAEGFYIYGKVDDMPAIIGVSATPKNEGQSSQQSEKGFPASFIINNKRITAEGRAVKENGRGTFYYSLEYNGTPYLIYIAVDGISDEYQLETFHRHQDVQRLFQQYVQF